MACWNTSTYWTSHPAGFAKTRSWHLTQWTVLHSSTEYWPLRWLASGSTDIWFLYSDLWGLCISWSVRLISGQSPYLIPSPLPLWLASILHHSLARQVSCVPFHALVRVRVSVRAPLILQIHRSRWNNCPSAFPGPGTRLGIRLSQHKQIVSSPVQPSVYCIHSPGGPNPWFSALPCPLMRAC